MRQDFLSQEEINLLIGHGLGANTLTETGHRSEAPATVPYDFSTHEVMIRSKIPTLDIIHHRFGRLLSQSLSGLITQFVDIELFSSDSITFGEFIRTPPVPASLHLFTMHPLDGVGVIALDSGLVDMASQHMLGKSRAARVDLPGCEFTASEHQIIATVVLTLEELEKAWEAIYPLKIRLERSESRPHRMAVMPARDMVMVATLEVRVDSLTGFLHICIPYSMLLPIKATLEAWFHNTRGDADRTWTRSLRRHLLHAEMELVAELGQTHITARQFLQLKVGDIMPLERGVDEPLLIKIQNIPKARALPGSLNGHHTIKFTSVLMQEEG